MDKVFEAEQIINKPIDQVFDFFSKAENLQKITPPLLDFKILTPLPIEMKTGTLIDYKIKVRGIPMKWKTLIELWEPPFRFVDTQLRGPYKKWHHTHEFKALSPTQTYMKDIVRYEVPFGYLGQIAEVLMVRRDIENIFSFRRTEIERLLGL